MEAASFATPSVPLADFIAEPAVMEAESALERIRDSELNAWPVTDGMGVLGLLSRARIEQTKANCAEATDLKDRVDPRYFPHVHGRSSAVIRCWAE